MKQPPPGPNPHGYGDSGDGPHPAAGGRATTPSESFTNQKPRVATLGETEASWGGRKGGVLFRCYLCGHHFAEGDYWRFVYAGERHYSNLMVCETCDGPDVLDRWGALHEEWDKMQEGRFWHFIAQEA